MCGIIHRYNKFWWIHLNLSSVEDLWSMGFSVSCWWMIENNLLQEVVKLTGCYSLVSFVIDGESMIEDVINALSISRNRKYRSNIRDECKLSLKIFQILLHDFILISIWASQYLIPLINNQNHSFLLFECF